MITQKGVTHAELIEKQIVLLRGEWVMLSTDLAALYGVEPRVLVQAVKRNLDRFPDDFMFQLTHEELTNLKSQNVISSWGGLRRASPYAFTEQHPMRHGPHHGARKGISTPPPSEGEGTGGGDFERRRGDAIERTAKRSRRAGERRDHTDIRAAASDGGLQRRTGSASA